MTFMPQPYPLYAGYWSEDKPTLLLIVGWVSPVGEHINSAQIQPVALFRNSDGSATEPKYIELDGEDPYWVGPDPDRILAQMAEEAEAGR